MFWHGFLGITLAFIAVTIEFFVKDQGTDNGFNLFNMDSKVLGLMVAATIGDTLAVNSMTIAF